MVLSYEQLDTPLTEQQALADLIQRYSELGFASKGWQSGDIALTDLQLLGWLYAKYTGFTQGLLRGSYNQTAGGTFLEKFSASHYDNTKKAAVAARYTVRHTTEVGEGPHTIQVGDLVSTNGSKTYRNIDDGSIAYPVTLTSSAPVDITYEAEEPGAASVTADGTITQLVTPVAGVTITNPTNSQVQAGADVEKDEALRERNRTKWGLLSIEVPADGYQNLALSATGVGRAKVDDQNPRGPGTVDVYIAGPSSVAGSSEETAAQAAIDARKSVTADVDVVLSASTNITLSGFVYYDVKFASVPTQAVAALATYVNEGPIGGVALTSSLRGVPIDGIYEAIRSVTGVLNVDLSSPTSDVFLPTFDIATAITAGLTFVPISP